VRLDHLLGDKMKNLVLAIILVFLLTACSYQGYAGLVKIQRTDNVLMTIPDIEPGDKVTVKWIHSVEKTPWEETYELQEDGTLRLIEAIFYSFGAGVPHEKGSMSVEEGKVVSRDMEEETIEAFRWIHSHDANFEVYINDELSIAAEELPHHEALELIFK
jgi:hypothetical protein